MSASTGSPTANALSAVAIGGGVSIPSYLTGSFGAQMNALYNKPPAVQTQGGPQSQGQVQSQTKTPPAGINMSGLQLSNIVSAASSSSSSSTPVAQLNPDGSTHQKQPRVPVSSAFDAYQRSGNTSPAPSLVSISSADSPSPSGTQPHSPISSSLRGSVNPQLAYEAAARQAQQLQVQNKNAQGNAPGQAVTSNAHLNYHAYPAQAYSEWQHSQTAGYPQAAYNTGNVQVNGNVYVKKETQQYVHPHAATGSDYGAYSANDYTAAAHQYGQSAAAMASDYGMGSVYSSLDPMSAAAAHNAYAAAAAGARPTQSYPYAAAPAVIAHGQQMHPTAAAAAAYAHPSQAMIPPAYYHNQSPFIRPFPQNKPASSEGDEDSDGEDGKKKDKKKKKRKSSDKKRRRTDGEGDSDEAKKKQAKLNAPNKQRSVIHCGVPRAYLQKQADGSLGEVNDDDRVFFYFSPFFGKELDVYFADDDPFHRPLFRASALHKKFECATNKMDMYLCRKKAKEGAKSGIFQCLCFDGRREEHGLFGLKAGTYFVSEDACQAFAEHAKEQRFRKKRTLRAKREANGLPVENDSDDDDKKANASNANPNPNASTSTPAAISSQLNASMLPQTVSLLQTAPVTVSSVSSSASTAMDATTTAPASTTSISAAALSATLPPLPTAATLPSVPAPSLAALAVSSAPASSSSMKMDVTEQGVVANMMMLYNNSMLTATTNGSTKPPM